MALVVKDRVKQQTTTTGTGTLTLSGSYTGFDTFSQIGDGNTTYYVITDDTTGDWEVGLGTYTAAGTTLSRDTILASSNAGSAVDLAAGTKVVFCGYPAGKSVYLDASGNLGISGTVSATAFTGATVTATSNIHTPTISVTDLQASTVTATSNIHTPAISATSIVASTVSATTRIHTPELSATAITGATVTATSNIHTPAISATNIVATSITTSVVFAISGQYGDELDSGFTPVFLVLDSPFTFTVDSFSRKLSAGAITVSVIIVARPGDTETTVTGLNGLGVNTTNTITFATGNNIVSVGNALALKLTGVAATDRNFAFTLKCIRNNFSGA
jgi:hypothetical protein